MKRGQALVIVLMIMGIVLTVGLSIISRSITEISVSTSSEESAKALEAAEQGIEKSLGGIIANGGADSTTVSNATVQIAKATVAGSAGVPFAVPYRLTAGEVATVNLNGYNANTIGVCWGDAAISPLPSASGLEIMLYYNNSGVQMGRTGVGQGFTAGNNGGNCPAGYRFSHSINLSALRTGGTNLLLRVRMLYNNAAESILFTPAVGQTIPSQGTDLISTGQSGTSTQKIRAVQLNPDLPLMFDAALFSGGDLVQ